MNLKFLQTTSCPICADSTIIKEEVELDSFNKELRQHTSGGMWEKRTFACGQQVDYIPNFNKDELNKYSICKNDPIVVERKRLREEAVTKTQAFIETLEVDEKFKERLKHEVSTAVY